VTTLTQRIERAIADKGLGIGDAWNLLGEALEYIERLEAALLEAKRALLDAAPMTTVAPDIEAIDAALSAQRGGE
jgi:hypothetical protein